MISRYVLVDENGHEDVSEFEWLHNAEKAALQAGHAAVKERRYVRSESVLVWTPNGEKVWPPQDNVKQKIQDAVDALAVAIKK